MAKRGKDGNPFFITEEHAKIMVKEIIVALELRVEKGRQWSLAPEKVGWEELLDRLCKGAWKVNRREYKRIGVISAKDILYSPASEENIVAAEEKVGELPADVKEMVKIANGFKGGYYCLSGGIAGIQNIYIEEENIESHTRHYSDLGFKLSTSPWTALIQLRPGAVCDSFKHYFIAPKLWKASIEGKEVAEGEYQYWVTAPWSEEVGHGSVRDYVASCVEEVEGMVERGEKADDTEREEEGIESEDEGSESESEDERSAKAVSNDRENEGPEEKVENEDD